MAAALGLLWVLNTRRQIADKPHIQTSKYIFTHFTQDCVGLVLTWSRKSVLPSSLC